MKKISVKKILVALLSLAITIYLMAVIASAVFMSRMTSLTYNATGFGVTLAEYQIDFEANTAERNYYNYDNTLSEHTKCFLTANQERKLKIIAAFPLMPLWKSNYNNPNIYDGNQWNLVKRYGNTKQITFGSNAYPLTYSFVLAAIQDVFV